MENYQVVPESLLVILWWELSGLPEEHSAESLWCLLLGCLCMCLLGSVGELSGSWGFLFWACCPGRDRGSKGRLCWFSFQLGRWRSERLYFCNCRGQIRICNLDTCSLWLSSIPVGITGGGMCTGAAEASCDYLAQCNSSAVLGLSCEQAWEMVEDYLNSLLWMVCFPGILFKHTFSKPKAS